MTGEGKGLLRRDAPRNDEEKGAPRNDEEKGAPRNDEWGEGFMDCFEALPLAMTR